VKFEDSNCTDAIITYWLADSVSGGEREIAAPALINAWNFSLISEVVSSYLCFKWSVMIDNRVTAFDVTGRKTSETLSNIVHFAHKTAVQESSKFYSDVRNASSQVLL